MSEKLAIHGGTAAIAQGPPDWPGNDSAVCDAVNAALKNGSWGKYDGQPAEELVTLLCEQFQRRHAMPVCSGTFAVELALRAVGADLKPGGEVLLAGYDFAGNFRAIEAVGCFPVLLDIDPATWCVDEHQLTTVDPANVSAIIVSHLHGGLANMPTIVDWARRHDIFVVEDACQSPGATIQNRPAGSWGDISVLSFGGSKLLTAGRGGAILTDDAGMFQRAKSFCEQGNHAFPLSALQAAALVPQLWALNERTKLRAERAAQMIAALAKFECLQLVACDSNAAFYKIAMLYHAEAMGGVSRQAFISACRAEGVAIDAGFRGFTKRSARRCRRHNDLPHATRAANDTLVLHHPVLLESESAIDEVAYAIGKVVRLLPNQR